MMPKFRIAKEKEQQENTIKQPQQNVYFFSVKAYVKKNLILNIPEFLVKKYANTLIEHKTVTVVNSFNILVFEVLGLSFLDTWGQVSQSQRIYIALEYYLFCPSHEF